MIIRVLTAVVGIVLAALLAECSDRDNVRNALLVVAPNRMLPVISVDIREQFEHQTDHKLVTASIGSGLTAKQEIAEQEIKYGITFDLVISSTSVIDDLISEGKLIASTCVGVAYTRDVWIGVRHTRPKPDIRTVEALKQTLLGANSVAYSATGESGDSLRAMFERLGIAEDMKPKLRFMPTDSIGEAEMIIVTSSEAYVRDVDVVGSVPPELRFINNRFAACVTANARHADAAKKFIALLTAPEAIQAIKARGMQPGAPN